MKIKIFCLCCLLAFSACAPQHPAEIPGDTQHSTAAWDNFLRLRGKSSVPMQSEGSLRFGEEGSTHRVTWLTWGNHSQALRFDIQAGMGSTLAKVWLDNGTLLLYLPDKNQLLHGNDLPEGVLHHLGLELPLPLHTLYAVMQGDFAAALDNPRILSTAPLPEQGLALDIKTNSPYMPLVHLELDSKGYPLRWSMPKSWDLKISYGDDALPRKIDGSRYVEQDKTLRCVLLIKNRESRRGFAPSELDLRMPEDIFYFSGF